jgi:hypothetical protein
MATIDRGGYKRKATDSFKRVHDESPRYARETPGNQLVSYKYAWPFVKSTIRTYSMLLNKSSVSAAFANQICLSYVPCARKRLIVEAKVKVTLRLTVSQSVSFGVELQVGLMTKYLLLFGSYGIDFVGRPL